MRSAPSAGTSAGDGFTGGEGNGRELLLRRVDFFVATVATEAAGAGVASMPARRRSSATISRVDAACCSNLVASASKTSIMEANTWRRSVMRAPS